MCIAIKYFKTNKQDVKIGITLDVILVQLIHSNIEEVP